MPQSTPTAEHEVLLRYLNSQRQHILGAIEGLSEEDLRRPVLPSGWTCLGLIQHLTLDVERFWFPGIVAGNTNVITELDTLNDAGAIWDVSDDTSPADVIDAYRDGSQICDVIIAATPLDAPPGWWSDELFGGWRIDTLREIILHVITETATHAGHLDAARELIDGHQWLVLTE